MLQPLTAGATGAKIVGSLGLHAVSHRNNSEGYPSGQRGQTVNLLAYAFGGSNPPPSTSDMRSMQQTFHPVPLPVTGALLAGPSGAGVVQW